jgi:hypothetical protein
MAAGFDGDKLVKVSVAGEQPPNRLRAQAVNLQSDRCAGHVSKKGSTQQISLGDDVTFDTRRIYESKNPGEVDWLAEDGLNNLVLRSYASGKRLDQAIAGGKVCPQDLTVQQERDLLRYRSLHDALVSKAHEFSRGAKDPQTGTRLLQEWEAGFLRPPRPTKKPPWWESIFD